MKFPRASGLSSLLLASALLVGCTSYSPVPAPGPAPAPEPHPGTPPVSEQPRAPQDDETPSRPPPAQAPTVALLRQSDRAAESGDVDSAIAYVERAIRLRPREAPLWLRLAELQLTAGRAETAEQLAHKAIALAGNREDWQRQGWLLIADARDALGRGAEAAQIRSRWGSYRG